MPPSPKTYNRKIFGILKTVSTTIEAHRMFQPGDSVLVAVSGGSDSVALLHILTRLASRFSIRLAVGHLDHGLRPLESKRDAEFVSSLARELDLPFFMERTDVERYRKNRRLSLEEAARERRYRFYHCTAEQNGFNKIALAHHRDDNAELILMRFLRGSGRHGLAGIPPVRNPMIVRPLLELSKRDLVDFLRIEKYAHVTDSSNQDMHFLRNRVRHQLIPELKQSFNPALDRLVTRQADIFRDEEEWIDGLITPLFKRSLIELTERSLVMSARQIAAMHPAPRRRIIRRALVELKGNLRRISFAHVDAVDRLIRSGPQVGSLDLPDRIRVERLYDAITFEKKTQNLRQAPPKGNRPPRAIVDYAYPVELPGSVLIGDTGGRIIFTRIDSQKAIDIDKSDNTVAFMDMNRLQPPLILRNARPNDRFRPLGMQGTQKLSRFFIQNKIPRNDRASCPLLVSGNEIVWIVGYRIADSVRIRPVTEKILKGQLLLA